MLSKSSFHRADFVDVLKKHCSNIFSRHPHNSLFQETKIDENEYFRNLAVELNNVAVDLYSQDDLSFAMGLYQNAIKAIMTSLQDDEDRTVTMRDAKLVFLNHIVEGKQRLYKITSSSSKKSCTKMGLDCYQWSDPDSGIGSYCISEPIKINCSENVQQDKDQCVSAAIIMYNVSLVNIKMRELDDAEDILSMAISMIADLRETTESIPNSFIIAMVLNNIGYIQHRINNHDEASAMFAEALDIGNKMLVQFVTEDSAAVEVEVMRRRKHVGTILFNNGVINSYLELGDDKVKKAFEYSLELQKMALGDDHPDIALIQHNIGVIYLETGRVNEAKRYFLESLKLSRKVYGNNHEHVARELFHLGHLHALKGEYDRALSVYQETYTVQKRVLGENHHHSLITMCEIAKIYHAREDLDKALDIYYESLSIAKITAGILSVPVVSILCKICKIHLERGDIHEGVEVHREIEKKIKYFNRMNIPVDYIEFAEIGHLLETPQAAGAA